METIEFLPVVKAFPALSRTYGEVSCIAGVEIADDGPRWIRLYPVPFRALGDTQQFRKYQRVRVQVSRHRGDRRPETRRPNVESIAPVGNPIASGDGWARRRRFIEPLMQPSMCEIQRRQRRDGTSLGVFRPGRVTALKIDHANVGAAKRQIARAWAAQGSLLSGLGADERGHQLKELELVQYIFKFSYRCDESACTGHNQSIIDWEIAEYYRRVRRRENWGERIREKWLGQLCGDGRDTAFFVGNQHLHPRSFLILGVWWPPVQAEQLSLADIGNV